MANTRPAEVGQIPTKVCTKCGERKPVTAFYKETSGKHGVRGECRLCNIAATVARQRQDGGAYRSWQAMKERCDNPEATHYAYYGGRGITYCDRWDSYENFYADMGPRPEGCSIDRVNYDGDYTPPNCRWATQAEQNNNKSNTLWLVLGVKRKPLTIWAAKVGMNRDTLYNRVTRLGWSHAKALLTPVKKGSY